MRSTDRRQFLKCAVGAAFAAGTPWLSGAHSRSALGSRGKGKVKVAALKGKNLGRMTREAVEALGGMGTIVGKGDCVFVKPNFVTFPWARYNNCFQNGECTKPEIVIAVAEECLKAGAREVIIGEGSHLPRFNWRYAVTLDGRTDLVKEAAQLGSKYKGKVTLACLETDSPTWVEIPSQTRHRKIAISSLLAQADKVISLPVAKTHSWAQLTLAAKNFIGVTPLSRYAQLIGGTWWNRGSFDHSSPAAIAGVYLDIVKAVKPVLSVVDFSIGIEGNGPSRAQGGTPVDMRERLGSWVILASTDSMAADATAARIMSHKVSEIKHLTMGFAMGCGEIRREHIELVGETLRNLCVPWKPAKLKGRRAKRGMSARKRGKR